MSLKSSLLKPIAVAALFVAAGASQAALTVYTSQALFLAAVTSPGLDTFAGFTTTGITVSPITRSAGTYSYTATAFNPPTNSSDNFFGAGTPADPWLSTNLSSDTITFSAFNPGLRAIGGNFFGSDINGAFLSGDITVVATDSLGATVTQPITAATTTSFLGFVSTGAVSTLVVRATDPASFVWPTVDNLRLATPVPEVQTYAMMLAGLGALGFIARRRRG